MCRQIRKKGYRKLEVHRKSYTKYNMVHEQFFGDKVQVDNGSEFVNDYEKTEEKSAFEKALDELEIKLKRTRPYSSWQSGKVERSHSEDGKILYKKYLHLRKI